ncbi:protein phosphatase PTC7 [Podospora australis]|uniref:Protein phosphatase n=1 Tax=Podospora australis TaxID=1536484 RepID=A0AAN7AMM2_9PEZI|nr:protein phosphatase PTC7 [Podospora australis]
MRRPAPQLLASTRPLRLRAAAVSAPVSQSAARWLRRASLPQAYRHHPRIHPAADQRSTFLTSRSPLLSNSPVIPSPSSSSPSTPEDKPPPPPPILDGEDRLDPSVFPELPFRFDTGIALFAKRSPRPFPPPFLSPPSGSFSDPLSTHDRSRDRRRAYVDGHSIQGYTNGDDAVFASDYFICANDGVGAWSTRPKGHAGLWARLILHFWATAIFEDAARRGENYHPDPVAYLQQAYEQTLEATSAPNDWQGTTTAAGALLHYRRGEEGEVEPLLYVTNLGDSQVMVVRPSTKEMIYKSTEQWHWFDCPRQLGTNSPDTPKGCAVVDEVPIREGDIVLAMSDGVIDNLWSHEIVENVSESLKKWDKGEGRDRVVIRNGLEVEDSGMGYVAEELKEAAKEIAVDPFAESPFMEHAIEEGLPSAGGKLDDISVVAAICKRNGS